MQREELNVDVLYVGAGPANLASAYRLARSLKAAGRSAEIMVIEKGQNVGDHILSGAIMDPRAMVELFGADWAKECPVEAEVKWDAVFYLSQDSAFKFPVNPPTLRNEGLMIVSLTKIVAWLKEKVEAEGVMICEAFPGAEILYDGERVAGVRTMDKGLGKDGKPGPTFQAGTDIFAKVTVLGEGSRGSLTKALVEKKGLAGKNPQVYGTGVKEVWDLPEGRVVKGEVFHTAGWPLSNDEYGGSWMYAMSDTRVSIGFVTALDSADPMNDPYANMQRWKTHPKLKALLAGGTLVKSGTKTVPEGGWWSRPISAGDGFLIIGDSGSLLNIARLKGIHTAMKSGMIAAETIEHALIIGDTSVRTLSLYERLLNESWVKTELWRTRNYRAAFKYGFWVGGLLSSVMYYTGGRLVFDPMKLEEDAKHMETKHWGFDPLVADGTLTFDKVTGVYHSGSVHNEHQPSHLVIADTDICRTKCAEEYGNPCERFCPAAVYEMVDATDGKQRMQINFSNCVHCKTCDIADPYGIITWTVPSDAGGPKYMGL